MDGATRTTTYMHTRLHDRSDFGGVQREESLSSSGSYPPVASLSFQKPPSPQQRAGQQPPSSSLHNHPYPPSSAPSSNHYAASPVFTPMPRKPDLRDNGSPGAVTHRQSLPSIHDIVSGPPLPHVAPSSFTPPSAPSLRTSSPPRSPRYMPSTPKQETHTRPLSPNGHYNHSQPPHGGQTRAGAEGTSRLAALHPINTTSTPPRDGAHQSYSAPSYSYGSRAQGYEHHRRSEPDGHAVYPYTSQAPISAPAGSVLTAYPVSSSAESGRQTATWRHSESVDGRATNDRGRSYPAPYGETIKRELDREFNRKGHKEQLVEAQRYFVSILNFGDRLANFSQHYLPKLREAYHQDSYLNALPSMPEIDELLRDENAIAVALNNIKDHVAEQAREQEKRSREQIQRKRAVSPSAEEIRQAEHRNSGDSSGPDPKKRRGRAAPPGRCHSCNRIETPEWRRGPDGARTLCNACGLHYAKLNRKAAQGKSTNGTTTLKAKEEKHSP